MASFIAPGQAMAMCGAQNKSPGSPAVLTPRKTARRASRQRPTDKPGLSRFSDVQALFRIQWTSSVDHFATAAGWLSTRPPRAAKLAGLPRGRPKENEPNGQFILADASLLFNASVKSVQRALEVLHDGCDALVRGI